MSDHPRSAFHGLNSVLKSLVRRINTSGYIAILGFWLETAYSRPLLGSFWDLFSPYDATHRPDPQKDRPWAETRHLSHSTQEYVHRFDLGQDRAKSDSISKKSQMFSLYFPYLGGSPRWADSTLMLHGDVITCAIFQIEIFMG